MSFKKSVGAASRPCGATQPSPMLSRRIKSIFPPDVCLSVSRHLRKVNVHCSCASVVIHGHHHPKRVTTYSTFDTERVEMGEEKRRAACFSQWTLRAVIWLHQLEMSTYFRECCPLITALKRFFIAFNRAFLKKKKNNSFNHFITAT